MDWDFALLLGFILVFGAIVGAPSYDHNFVINENGLRHYVLVPENYFQDNLYNEITAYLFLRYENPWVDHYVDQTTATIFFIVGLFITLSVLNEHIWFWWLRVRFLSLLSCNPERFVKNYVQSYTSALESPHEHDVYSVSCNPLNSNLVIYNLFKNISLSYLFQSKYYYLKQIHIKKLIFLFVFSVVIFSYSSSIMYPVYALGDVLLVTNEPITTSLETTVIFLEEQIETISQANVYSIINAYNDNPSILLLVLPFAGLALIHLERKNLKKIDYNKTLCLSIASIILFSLFTVPMSISTAYWNEFYAFGQEGNEPITDDPVNATSVVPVDEL